MGKTWYQLLSILFIWTCAVSAYAQRPSTVSDEFGRDGQRQNSSDTTGAFIQQRDRFFNDLVDEDTLDASYYNLLLPSIILPVSDTALHGYSHQYDWSRLMPEDYAHLGNVGSAAFPLVFSQYAYEGRDIGLHQLDLWKFGEKDRRFYELTKSFSHFHYSQADQANQVFKATFARSFEDNINIALDYRRINQVGIYQQQDVDHSNLHFGLNYNSPDNRYSAYISLLSNGLQGDESGGIATDTLFGTEDFDKAALIPILLEEGSEDGAQYRHQERSYQFYQSYRLVRDSSDLTKPKITLSNAFTYERNFYKYGDIIEQSSETLNLADKSFYPVPFQVNPQGLRMFIDETVYSNHFKIFLGKTVNPLDTASRKTHIEAGLKLKSHQLSDEVRDSSIFDVMLTGGGLIDISDRVSLFTNNHFVVAGDNAGTYRIEGDFHIDFTSIGTLRASILNQNHSPSIIHQNAPISGQYLWQNQFSNINELSLKARYGIAAINAEVGFGYHLLNNYIYYDSGFNPIQKSSEVSILQLSLSKNFRLGKFHLDNYAVYQNSSSIDVPLPTFYSKHSLYFEGPVFKKKMQLRTGFDARIVDGYKGYSYMPLTGQFSPATEGELATLNQIDFFLSFKVGKMRAFVKMEHLEDFLNINKEYLVKDHPIYDSSLRFGLSWYLIN